MKIVVLDAKTLGDDADLDLLRRFGRVTAYPVTPPGRVAERIAEADAVVTNKVVIDRHVMDNAPALKLICVAATGMNNVDLDHAREKGVAVRNVAGYSTESVVQVTFSHVLYLLQQHAYYDGFAKSRWQESDIFTHLSRPFYELSDKQWGIIGLGTIGRRVARVAQSFGCRVVYCSPSGKNRTADYRRVSLEELLGTSRVISIHTPLNPHTQNLIDYEKLSLICDGGIIVNTGRGGIICEADLARIIDERTIYAGTDVVSGEPVDPDNPLLRVAHRERLSITPHIAWASIEARQRLLQGIADNIETFISGTALRPGPQPDQGSAPASLTKPSE